jgi:hypothetical protein
MIQTIIESCGIKTMKYFAFVFGIATECMKRSNNIGPAKITSLLIYQFLIGLSCQSSQSYAGVAMMNRPKIKVMFL